MKTYYLYKHTFPNNKVYIGITSQNPTRRWRNGKGYLMKNPTTNAYTQPLMAYAIEKYGWDNVSHEILLQTSDKLLIEQKERYYITEVYHSNDERFGYNIANGGNYYGLFSDKTKELLSIKKKGTIPWNKGKTFSEEAKKRMSEAHKGKIIPKEVIEKARNSRKGFKHSEESKKKMSLKALNNKHALGCKRSKEFCEAISKRKKGQMHSALTKQIISDIKKKQKWWTNGIIETMAENPPDQNWINGRLSKWKQYP